MLMGCGAILPWFGGRRVSGYGRGGGAGERFGVVISWDVVDSLRLLFGPWGAAGWIQISQRRDVSGTGLVGILPPVGRQDDDFGELAAGLAGYEGVSRRDGGFSGLVAGFTAVILLLETVDASLSAEPAVCTSAVA